MCICLLGVEVNGDVIICSGESDSGVWYVNSAVNCCELDGRMLVVEPLHEACQLMFPFEPKHDDVVREYLFQRLVAMCYGYPSVEQDFEVYK